MSAELNYRMARLRQAEYLRQAEEVRRVNDVLRTGSAPAPPGRISRLLLLGRRRSAGVAHAAPLRAHEPVGCDG
jgi:hypothetical protein